MIEAVAFCPQPPMIVPELAQGAADELDLVRRTAIAAIREACPDGRSPILLGPGAESRLFPPPLAGTLAGFGLAAAVRLGTGQGADGTSTPDDAAATRTDRPDAATSEVLPPSLAIGVWLTGHALGSSRRALAAAVGPDFATTPAAAELARLAEHEDVALLVFGDGSARRSTTAPGYFDERAAGFDADVAKALASGEGAALGALDVGLGAQLWAAGPPAWHAAGCLLDGHTYRARLDYDDAPYGVGYFVATWTDPRAVGDD